MPCTRTAQNMTTSRSFVIKYILAVFSAADESGNFWLSSLIIFECQRIPQILDEDLLIDTKRRYRCPSNYSTVGMYVLRQHSSRRVSLIRRQLAFGVVRKMEGQPVFEPADFSYDDIDPVGYYDWYWITSAMFILGDSNKLVYAKGRDHLVEIRTEMLARLIEDKTSAITYLPLGKLNQNKGKQAYHWKVMILNQELAPT